MFFILDTNVVSELREIRYRKANEHVARWADGSAAAADLYLSAITVQELEIGILLAERPDPVMGLVFRSWMNDHVLPVFANRILPVDRSVALRTARLHDRTPGFFATA